MYIDHSTNITDTLFLNKLFNRGLNWIPIKIYVEQVAAYGFRGKDPNLFYLSPWEFCQWYIIHKLRPPAHNYNFTRLTSLGEAKVKEKARPLQAGIDFVLNEDVIENAGHMYPFPEGIQLDSCIAEFGVVWAGGRSAGCLHLEWPLEAGGLYREDRKFVSRMYRGN